MEISYFNREIETAPRQQIEKIQLQRLQEIVDCAMQTPFYKRRLTKVGISCGKDVASLEDLKKIPFTTKDDLRQNFPKGLLSTDMSNVVRIHSSSGTTGIPTVIYFTAEDIDRWTDLIVRSIVATGAVKDDIFQNMMTYGLFTGGIGLHYGAERLGMAVIPIGGGNTTRQFQFMQDFKTTILHVTPSYLLHLYSKLEESGFSIDKLNLKKAFIGAEPHSERIRQKIEELYHIDAYNSYGLSEMNGPGMAFECVYKDSMHVWEDAYIPEIINPATGEDLPDGQEGEFIATNLIRKAMPLLRYRTRDLTHLIAEPCKCGRTHKRLSRIVGRTDDMLIINGVNVFPSQIEEVIMKIPEVGTNYLIQVEKAGALDKLIIKVEIYSKMFLGEAKQIDMLKGKIKDGLRASITINAVVELNEPGSLPVSQGKAKRVVDTRPEI